MTRAMQQVPRNVALAVCVASSVAAWSCGPGTASVKSTVDSGSDSLRAAIAHANANGGQPMRIELATGTYGLSQCGAPGNDTGDLDISTTAPITIVGTGPNVVIQQTCPGERVLEQHGMGQLRLIDVTISGGALTGDGSENPVQGGGLRAEGDVYLERAKIQNNSVKGADGAAPGATNSDAQATQGGGLYVGGSLEALDSSFTSNDATGGAGLSASQNGGVASAGGKAEGGAAYVIGTVNVERTAFSTNKARGGDADSTATAGDAKGGAIAASGALTGKDITAVQNSATGGSNQLSSGAPAGAARGGAFAAASVSLTNSAFDNNVAQSGNARFVCTSTGPFGIHGCSGAAPSVARGGAVWAATSVSLFGGNYTRNFAAAGTGGTTYLDQLMCERYGVCIHRAELPQRAAGGAVASDGALMATGGSFSSNVSSHVDSPYMFIFSRVVGEDGAALSAGADAGISGASIDGNAGAPTISVKGKLQISNSDVSRGAAGISAQSVDANALTISGSASFAIVATQTVSLVNVTLANNGSGISADTLSLVHSTISDPGAPYEFVVSHMTSRASFVAKPTAKICANQNTVSASDSNWFADTSCGLAGAGDHQGTADFLLLPLANAGGPVRTLVPAAASVLVNAIPGGACAVAVDARGTARPQGSGCDIGAVELAPVANAGPADLAVAFQSPPDHLTPGSPITLQVKVSNRGPGAAGAALFVEVPEGVTLTAFTASEGGTCAIGTQNLCTWNAGIASGSSALVTLTGSTRSDLSGTLPFKARAIAPQPTGSTADDQASLSLPAQTSSGLELGIAYSDDVLCNTCARQRVFVTNHGPSEAIGTTTAPVRFTFTPSAGIVTDPPSAVFEFVGTIPVGSTVPLGSFGVTRASASTTVLGTVHVDTGINHLTGPNDFVVKASSLKLRLRRDSGVTVSGAPGTLTVDVTNNGSETAKDVLVSLRVPGYFRFEPTVGELAPDNSAPTWRIPALAAGQTVTLTSSTPHFSPSGFATLTADLLPRPFEFDLSDNSYWMDYGFAPLGTADMRVVSVQVSANQAAKTATITATVENAGPFAAVQSSTDPIIVLPMITSASPRGISGESLSPGWTCDADRCSPLQTLVPGARATLRFVTDTRDLDPSFLVGVTIRSVPTPDNEPSNNTWLVPLGP